MKRVVLVAALFVVSACDAKKPATTPPPEPAPVAARVPDQTPPAVQPEAAPAAEPRVPPMPNDPQAPAAAVPEVYKAEFRTTKGVFVIEVTKAWAPIGAVRFYNLVKGGFYDDVAFFRVIPNFMVQFGMHGNPVVAEAWQDAKMTDDPVAESNKRGFVTFAMAGRDSRTTQVFINFKDNTNLDKMGFAPFGAVVAGMDVVDNLYGGYGEGAPSGSGPSQNDMRKQGNAYLKESFPDLDWVYTANVL